MTGQGEDTARRAVEAWEGFCEALKPAGGVLAREVARTRPTLVRRVVTYGTPAVGGPTYTAGAATWGEEACARAAELTEQWDRDTPISVPVTALFSRRDGVVDRTSRAVENVEVGSRHLGMGTDPDVWSVVADRLARPDALRRED